jgi:hypothetical protein
MIITLPPDIAHVLAERAYQQGTTPELLVVHSLRERFLPSVSNDSRVEREGTLADFLNGYIGVLHSSEHIPGGAQMSQDSGSKFAEGMVEKRQQGRL